MVLGAACRDKALLSPYVFTRHYSPHCVWTRHQKVYTVPGQKIMAFVKYKYSEGSQSPSSLDSYRENPNLYCTPSFQYKYSEGFQSPSSLDSYRENPNLYSTPSFQYKYSEGFQSPSSLDSYRENPNLYSTPSFQYKYCEFRTLPWYPSWV